MTIKSIVINGKTILSTPIVIEGHSFICNDQRMWNLNEIHRVLGLPASKMPSEWNNKIRTQLDRSGKFVQKWNPDSYADELRPQEKAFSIGLFVTKSVMGKDTWQVTAKGYAWMQGNAQKRLNRGGK